MTTTQSASPGGAGDTAATSSPQGDGPNPVGPHVNDYVRQWVDTCAALCQPDCVVWCDGSEQERRRLIGEGLADGTFIELNQQKLPGCYLHRSNPNDVARTEQLTFICTPGPDMAGLTNNWMNDRAAYAKLRGLFHGCMKGRTMYVVPFVMGPTGSPLAKVGVQLTDSVYVAVSMGLMTRMGEVAWKQLGTSDEFTRCLHSLGDVNPDRRYIAHFPLDNTIWSFGSGYGGNALLGKKCLALRLASFLGQQQGWMAEHMLLLGATGPTGEKTYVAAAFPSASGKTNFAMMIPPPEVPRRGVEDHDGWRRHRLDVGGRGERQAAGDQPRGRLLRRAAGHEREDQPQRRRQHAARHDLHERRPHTRWRRLVGGQDEGTAAGIGRLDGPEVDAGDRPGDGAEGRPPQQPVHRAAANNPALDPAWDDPSGVPVSAIVFGGRRSRTIPLVYQAFNWIHGVYVGATLGSETTAAATGQVGVVRRDPMAMLPFIGYNVRDYLVHWFRMRKKMSDCPRVFHVNWFRKDAHGNFIWPGFGENMRVLKWIIDRSRGRAYARETIVGWMPRPKDIDIEGLSITQADLDTLQSVDPEEFKSEILSQEELFLKLAGDMPKEMVFQRELLVSRL